MTSGDAAGQQAQSLARRIFWAMFFGIILGLFFHWVGAESRFASFVLNDCLRLIGQIFIRLIKMLVVPIVLVSLICGSASVGQGRDLGRMGTKAIFLYITTTALAVSLALIVALLLQVGSGVSQSEVITFLAPAKHSLHDVILNMIPDNPIKALTEGQMLQVVIFALMFGVSLGHMKEKVPVLNQGLEQLNDVLIRLVLMIMNLAPIGVFCLLAVMFSHVGFAMIAELARYFFTVVFVLLLQLLVVYSLFVVGAARMNLRQFFAGMRSAMMFAFSVSSSSASIPVVLQSVQKRLGVGKAVASFVIPLGATINMDGTAIMQGVATVFIAHVYHVSLGFVDYATVVAMATLASVGTAGVPGVGLLTLSMVLEQVGLPVQGIALIIGVDRLLDMMRTAVNVAGDAMVSCVVARSEGLLQMPK